MEARVAESTKKDDGRVQRGVQQLVQAVAYARAVEAVWWLGRQFDWPDGAAASSLVRMLAAVVDMWRDLS